MVSASQKKFLTGRCVRNCEFQDLKNKGETLLCRDTEKGKESIISSQKKWGEQILAGFDKQKGCPKFNVTGAPQQNGGKENRSGRRGTTLSALFPREITQMSRSLRGLEEFNGGE